MQLKTNRYGYYVIPVEHGMLDDEIRKLALSVDGMNTSYCSQICRNCGSYTTDLDTHMPDSKIANQCKFCFEEN